jgi:hypothetical protein
MTTTRDLIQRLADELDAETNYIIHSTGERVTHPDVAEARAFLSQPEPKEPTDQELLQIAAATIDPYESNGIALDEYEAETECAVEAYGSELIAFARAVLARWGK